MPINLETLIVGGMGGFASALLTQVISIIRDGKKDHKDVVYSALRIAVALERYAFLCHDHIMGVEGDLDRHQEAQEYNIPDMDDYPSDIDWRKIDIELSNEAMSFKNKVEITKSKILFAIMYENNNYMSVEEAAIVGVSAYAIAFRIRDRYGLPRLDEMEKEVSDMQNRNEYILKRRHNIEMAAMET